VTPLEEIGFGHGQASEEDSGQGSLPLSIQEIWFLQQNPPLTKWITYPAMLRGVRRRWEQSQMAKPRNRVI